MKFREEKVSPEVVSVAYDNFIKMFYPNEIGKGFYLWNFIGAKGQYNLLGEWSFEPLQARRLHGLAGPYHEAIAKILLSQGCDPYTELNNGKE